MNRTARILALSACLTSIAAPAAIAGTADGTVVGATKLLDNGTDAERFDIVLVAEGYRASEQAVFASQAQQFLNELLQTAPFDRLERALNVWRIDVTSLQSGADDPVTCAGPGIRPRTYFDSSFCTGFLERSLLSLSHASLLDVVDNYVPAWDQIVVLVNSQVPGGLAGSVTITSVAPGWRARLRHTIGHSAFGLGDEYDHFGGCPRETGRSVHAVVEPAAANVTVESSRLLVKWADLIAGTTPVPTSENPEESCTSCAAHADPYPGSTVVGVYEGGNNFPCGVYRPAFHCAMRDLGAFCPVCERRIAAALAAYLDDATNALPVCDAGGPYYAECGGPSTAVLLDGSGSSDPDGDALSYHWSGPFESGAAEGSPATLEFAGTGTFAVSLEVTDGVEPATCDTAVVVEDTLAPTLVPPPDARVECAASTGTNVELGNATATDVCEGALEATNDAPSVFARGTTTVTWHASDSSGNGTTATQRVTVADDTAPQFSIEVSPSVLWPPNHQFVPVVVTVDLGDACDDSPDVRLVSVTSSEDARVAGSGSTEVDVAGAAIGTDDRELELRAERSGNGGGRVYTLVYEAVDAAGNRSLASARVVVPPDRGVTTPKPMKR